MRLPSRFVRWLRASRNWAVLAVLAPIGMLAITGAMLLDLRQDAWDKATRTSRNLLQVIERDIARNVEIIDLSLRGAAENLAAPGVSESSPPLRQLVLFDRASTATDMGALLVLDASGDVIYDSHAVPARPLNNADRDYFQAHATRGDLGLVISRPVLSRLLGVPVIVLSRRITKPDGGFGGIVSASLKMSYFTRLVQNIGLGSKGAISLYLRDGTQIMRQPHVEADIGANMAESPVLQRFLKEPEGSFVGDSTPDDVRRLYVHIRIGDLPLILSVALATDEIEAEWRGKALVIGLMVLTLCSLAVGLSLLFGRELRRRVTIEAELARLSLTDALTGLANRRRFEEAFSEAWCAGGASDTPRALLVVDADHFKSINDRYGHAVGDAVLRGLAQCLSASVRTPDDLICRVGGEEFVVLLSGADEGEALRIADRIHAAVADFANEPAGIPGGSISVSIGVASTRSGTGAGVRPDDLYRSADAALYEAKANGRKQTRSVSQRVSGLEGARMAVPRAGAG